MTQKGIIGITNMSVSHSAGEATKISVDFVAKPNYYPSDFLTTKWDDLFPGNVVVKCGHCGQWAARQTVCKHCGAAVD